jgi:hypothetical protein
MNTRERIEKKFKVLESELDAVSKTVESHLRTSSRPATSWVTGRAVPLAKIETIDTAKWFSWCTSAMHLLKWVFGESSVHLTEFEKVYNSSHSFSSKTEALGGILSAAKADYEGGYAIKIEASIAGEVFADFVALAKEALNQKQKDVAAVLACAALEDTLKRIGTTNGLDVAEKEMSQVINAIKAAGLIGGGAAKLVDRMPKIRNDAMHANWEKLTEVEIGGVIGFVDQLILAHFSPS